jgi:hypothetical protein
VRDVYQWDATAKEWQKVSIGEPSSLMAEDDHLRRLASHLSSEWEETQKGNNPPKVLMNEFGPWDPAHVEQHYIESVERAKEWMFSKTEIFGN